MTQTGTGTIAPPALPDHRDERPVGVLVFWGLAATAVAVVHNRMWATPNLGFFVAITERLGERPFGDGPSADYLLTNLGLPALARLTGQTAPHEYARMHALVLWVGLAVCVALARRHHGHRAARTLTVMLAAAPGVTVVLQWLGQPDALTFPLGVALGLVRWRGGLVTVGILLGLTHPEQAVIIVGVAAIVRLMVHADDGPARAVRAGGAPLLWDRRLRTAGIDLVAMAVGVAIGRLVTEIYLRSNDIQILRPRGEFLRLGADVFTEHHLQEPVALVYLLWGPLWLVIVGTLVARLVAWRTARSPVAEPVNTAEPTAWGRHPTIAAPPRPHGRTWLVLAALSVAMVVPVLVTLDETRVYAMLTAPVVAGAAVLLARDPATRRLSSAGAAALLLTLVAVVPGGFTAGTSTWSLDLSVDEMSEFLRDGTHPGGLDGWLMSPFEFVIPTQLQN